MGSRHESAKEAGLSHFLEHMLFKGTTHRSATDLARAVEQVGGEFNAFTTREHTCFHVTLLDRDYGLGIDILEDVLLNSVFDNDEFERERSVILQEIAMSHENPEELSQDLFFEKAFGKIGLGRQILGSERSIKEMPRAELIKFFRRYYRPDNIVITIAGNISHATLVKRFRALGDLTPWPGRTVLPRKRTPEIPTEFRKEKFWVDHASEQVHTVVGFQGPHSGSRDRIACLVMNHYLGVGMGSLLFQEIRERHALAYSVYSHYVSYWDVGLVQVYAASAPSRVNQCIDIVLAKASELSDSIFSEEQLMSLKHAVKKNLILASDTAEGRMQALARDTLIYGRPFGLDKNCDLIDALTSLDLRRVARRFFHPGHASVLCFGAQPARGFSKGWKKSRT